jgi:DNA-binding GntR family transcriptional regulator
MSLSAIPQFQPIWEVVLERLRAAILTGELPAGRKLVEVDLAEQFGVSRGPVREALRELARAGLVVDVPRGGTVVCTITQADLMEVYAVREGVEAQAVRDDALVMATTTELELVRTAHERMVEAWQGDDWQLAINADMEFHRAIVTLSKNQRLITVYEQMAHQTLLLLITASERDLTLRAAPLEEIHKAMADAVMNRDLEAATDAIRRHYWYTRQRLLSSLDFGGND